MQSNSINGVLNSDPKELVEWLDNNFTTPAPREICSIDDMNEASEKLLKITSDYSYLMSLLSYAKIAVRDAKRDGDKTSYEDMVDRKESIENKAEAVKQSYAAISRAVTIKINNDTELRMTGR